MNASPNRISIFASLGLAALLGGFALKTVSAQPTTSAPPPPSGKITPWAAIKIAQSKVPGRPLQANFEFDEGKWVYGVMIVSGKTIKEVEIDPSSGKVGDVESVTPNGEAKEVRAELTKAIGGTPAAKKGEADEKDENDEKGEKPE